MNEVDRLELACADAWPAEVDRPLGQWRLRAAGGFTGRANSTLTVGDPGRPVPDALDHIVGFAREHDIPPKAHVVRGSTVEPVIAAAGWLVDAEHPGGAEAVVLTGPPALLTSAARPARRLGVPVNRARAGWLDPAGVEVLDGPPHDWWPLALGAAESSVAARHVLSGAGSVDAAVGFGIARAQDGTVVGVVRGAVVGDLLHVARLAVAPGHRRSGLGTELMAAVAGWAGRLGATRCALQVATHNAGALRLYGGLGLRQHHRYRYWVPARP